MITFSDHRRSETRQGWTLPQQSSCTTFSSDFSTIIKACGQKEIFRSYQFKEKWRFCFVFVWFFSYFSDYNDYMDEQIAEKMKPLRKNWFILDTTCNMVGRTIPEVRLIQKHRFSSFSSPHTDSDVLHGVVPYSTFKKVNFININ